MRITVKLFAVLREKAGWSEKILDLSDGMTAASAVGQLSEQFPALGAAVGKCACAVNHEYAAADRVLHEGDELALIPAVSGGW